ncbi:MAG TPA: AAA family ATPase [Thiotrichaceae bacterium]|jgi:type II secretory pathway predicted ATPase ExeA|nr:AAA family ATPase [Thiotrichaceae bacterium]HIM08525.1 AAA family ATPase [Gammaproteobacteria bacterium]
MYYEYFGLKQPPFKITPDTSLFFPGGDRGAILDALIYAIVSGEGIVKLVGEVGSGKTTICRMLEKELPVNVEIVYLANPSLSPDHILHAIAFELDLKVAQDDSHLKVMHALQNYLLERHAENKQVVVFVEEAQSMPIATLEEIRLLSNLETAQNKLLQIVIFGQPELDTMISKPEIRQLKERITYSFYLSPFKSEEVKDYINSRLRACGYRSVELFDVKAIKLISKYSNGLLRRINILADKALLASYAGNQNKVSVKHVELAADETEFVDKQDFSIPRWGLISTAVIMVAVIMIVFLSYKNSSEQNHFADIVKNSESSKAANASLMLIEEARESVVVNESAKRFSVTEPINSVAKVYVPKPALSELETAQWQSAEQSVYFYPESIYEPEHKPDDTAQTVVTETEERMSDNEVLEIRNLASAVRERGEDDEELLNQLTVLPSETAINHKTVASGLTCKLCSTIIYRPLRDNKSL